MDLSFIFWIIALVLAVDIHEFSHALLADKLGDPTPRLNGRMTLNPIAHLDPIGSLALLLFHIGWGKPVPIDAFNLQNPRRDAAIISIAGPASNLALATILSIIIRFSPQLAIPQLLITFFATLIIICVGLGIFNLIPVPPLDGSKILFAFFPPQEAAAWEEALNQYGLIILIFLLFPLFGNAPIINILIMPVINFILNLLLPFGSLAPLI